MPFFLEYDTGTEQLSILVDKLTGYHDLFTTIGRSWPVLFWLHSAPRERNLRTVIADLPVDVPVATGARDYAAAASLSPADAVWIIQKGGHHRVSLSAVGSLHVMPARP